MKIPSLFLSVAFALASLAAASAQTILIDFGISTSQMASPNAGDYWNNVTNTFASVAGSGTVGGTLALVTTANGSSGITLTISDLFDNENHGGTNSPSTGIAAFNYNNLGIESLFVSNSNTTAGVSLTGLNAGYTYTFTLFASRISTGGDNRSADYTFDGLGAAQTVTLNASENTSNTVSTTAITPDSNTITFSMAKAATNTNTNGYAYLGGMQITIVPEPATVALAFGSLGTMLFLRRCFRKNRF